MKTVAEVALELAEAHKQADPEIQQIYWMKDPADNEVRLLEVSKSAENTGSLMPFRFAARPDLGIPYPSVVVLLSPGEKSLLDDNSLSLPANWGQPEDLRTIG